MKYIFLNFWLFSYQVPKISFQCHSVDKTPQLATSPENNLDHFEPITVTELFNIISKLDFNTSTGIDGINVKSLKCILLLECNPIIFEKLTKSFYKCLIEGILSDSFKLPKVTSIYK